MYHAIQQMRGGITHTWPTLAHTAYRLPGRPAGHQTRLSDCQPALTTGTIGVAESYVDDSWAGPDITSFVDHLTEIGWEVNCHWLETLVSG